MANFFQNILNKAKETTATMPTLGSFDYSKQVAIQPKISLEEPTGNFFKDLLFKVLPGIPKIAESVKQKSIQPYATWLKEKAKVPETPEEMTQFAMGFMPIGELQKFIPEIETAKKLGYKVSESVKGFTNKLFKYRIQRGADLMYANTPQEIAKLTGQKITPKITPTLQPLAQEAKPFEFKVDYEGIAKQIEDSKKNLNHSRLRMKQTIM